jgi:hypothetical protein
MENMLRNIWELIGNIVGTQWEPSKNGKKKNSTMPAFTVLQGVLTLDQPYF